MQNRSTWCTWVTIESSIHNWRGACINHATEFLVRFIFFVEMSWIFVCGLRLNGKTYLPHTPYQEGKCTALCTSHSHGNHGCVTDWPTHKSCQLTSVAKVSPQRWLNSCKPFCVLDSLQIQPPLFTPATLRLWVLVQFYIFPGYDIQCCVPHQYHWIRLLLSVWKLFDISSTTFWWLPLHMANQNARIVRHCH